jgi:Tfp pilus assembly major pilin PilA
LKIFLWIIGFIVLLFVLFVVIQIPSVQNYAKDKAVTYLEGKIKTKIKVDSLSIVQKKLSLLGVF